MKRPSGVALASYANAPALNPETAAAHNAEVVRQKQKAVAALQLAGETIEDILITLTSQLHLLKLNATGTMQPSLHANARQRASAVSEAMAPSPCEAGRGSGWGFLECTC